MLQVSWQREKRQCGITDFSEESYFLLHFITKANHIAKSAAVGKGSIAHVWNNSTNLPQYPVNVNGTKLSIIISSLYTPTFLTQRWSEVGGDEDGEGKKHIPVCDV